MSGDDPRPKKDVLFLHSLSEDGKGIRVVRARESSLELAEIRPVSESEPIKGELVRLKQRREHARLFDVETVLPQEPPRQSAHKGPPKVSTQSFREGWDTVFAGARKKELLN